MNTVEVSFIKAETGINLYEGVVESRKPERDLEDSRGFHHKTITAIDKEVQEYQANPNRRKAVAALIVTACAVAVIGIVALHIYFLTGFFASIVARVAPISGAAAALEKATIYTIFMTLPVVGSIVLLTFGPIFYIAREIAVLTGHRYKWLAKEKTELTEKTERATKQITGIMSRAEQATQIMQAKNRQYEAALALPDPEQETEKTLYTVGKNAIRMRIADNEVYIKGLQAIRDTYSDVLHKASPVLEGGVSI